MLVPGRRRCWFLLSVANTCTPEYVSISWYVCMYVCMIYMFTHACTHARTHARTLTQTRVCAHTSRLKHRTIGLQKSITKITFSKAGKTRPKEASRRSNATADEARKPHAQCTTNVSKYFLRFKSTVSPDAGRLFSLPSALYALQALHALHAAMLSMLSMLPCCHAAMLTCTNPRDVRYDHCEC